MNARPAPGGSRTARLSDTALPSLPTDPLPVWPGLERDGLFVRRTPPSDGEPALLVHGLGGSSANWTDLMALLAPWLDAEALDLPGFGRSAPPADGRYTVGSHARAVIRHLEASGRGPVHLLGNSLGGAVCTRVAATRPDLVRTLTLVSPALPDLRVRRTDPRLPLLLLPGTRRVAQQALARQSPERRAKAVLQLCFADPSSLHPTRVQEAVEEAARRAALPHAQDAFAASLRALVGGWLQPGERSLWARAAQVQAPVLLVWGTEDRLVDVALAPRALATFPDARLLVLPAVGHVAQMERPVEVARAVLALVEDTRAATATT